MRFRGSYGIRASHRGLIYINQIKKDIEEALNTLEYVAHQLNLQSLEQPKDQLDFFDIPPEPSSDDYELWEINRKVAPYAQNLYRDQSQSLDPAGGFLNG
jgi:hypothetical protein